MLLRIEFARSVGSFEQVETLVLRGGGYAFRWHWILLGVDDENLCIKENGVGLGFGRGNVSSSLWSLFQGLCKVIT